MLVGERKAEVRSTGVIYKTVYWLHFQFRSNVLQLTESHLFARSLNSRGWKGGFTPYSDLYWDPPPERSSIFQASAYERVEISLVEVYERVGKSVISAGKKAQKANMHFIAVKT